MIMRKLSINEQSALNIVGALTVVCINTLVNFFLSPYIVRHLGIEANGYITLANNFVSYFSLITIALNSMAGRFMLIELRKNRIREANEYYSSVFFGDWILAVLLLVPAMVLVIRIDRFIRVSETMQQDIMILFALTFLNFFIGLCIPKWSNATYSTNKLYLRSLKTMLTTVLRALAIFALYRFFPPFAFYVALAGVIMTIVNAGIEYIYKIRLLPELHIKLEYCNIKKIQELIVSGIWNTISQCGNLLLEGIDILVANLFINPVASGVLSLSKIVPNMINQIVGNIATTFGPRLTYLYADGDFNGMVSEVNSHIKIISIIANIPIGITFVFGMRFFSLWVPSQDSLLLTALSSLTLSGMLFTGISNCIINIFTAVNKLRVNSLVVIISGLLNVILVYILLKNTGWGLYVIAGVSSFVSIARVFVFTAPYAAYCIHKKWYSFYAALFIGGFNVLIPAITGFLIVHMIRQDSWFMFCIGIGSTTFITILLDYFFMLNRAEKSAVLKLLHVKG